MKKKQTPPGLGDMAFKAKDTKVRKKNFDKSFDDGVGKRSKSTANDKK